MKKNTALLFNLFLIIFAHNGCSDNSSKQQKGDLTFQVAWPTSSGKYQLQNKVLRGINDVSQLSGSYAQFYVSPQTDKVNSQLTGQPPLFHFYQNSEGIFFAGDDVSLAAASLYAHMQELFDMDTQLGVQGVNQWPRKVGLAKYVEKKNKNNAFYIGASDAIIYSPYTLSDLPLVVNAGVIAHEYFHSLFYKLADKKAMMNQNFYTLTEEGSVFSDYHITLLRSMSEGFADYWAWMYTQDADYALHSFNNNDDVKNRSLNTLMKPIDFFQKLSQFKSAVTNYSLFVDIEKEKVLTKMVAYPTGTLLAQVLKGYTEVIAQNRKITLKEAQKIVAQSLLKSLSSIATTISSLSEKDFYDITQVLAEIHNHNLKSTEAECLFIRGIIKPESSKENEALCKK